MSARETKRFTPAETKLLVCVKHSSAMARGALLDEAALISALCSGALSGAALDVASAEPLPADSPLWKAPNLFLTPHISGVSDRLWRRQTELLLRLLDEWFTEEELSNRVDLSRGY